jgi:hypothetical protein
VQSLEFYQLNGDFAAVERVLDGLRLERYRATTTTRSSTRSRSCLYLLLFFDIDPGTIHRFAQTYDKAAKHVYGTPRPRSPERKPGRLRIGYLSADLRDHVMGKMMWEAVSRHDRERFDVYFYSMTPRRDAWTERFERLATGFPRRNVAHRPRRRGADPAPTTSTSSSTCRRTRASRARASSRSSPRACRSRIARAPGTLGLSTIDWKLTDAYADLPESQETQVEPLLAMGGCVYPYRAVAAAAAPASRARRCAFPTTRVVIGAFVTPLKLSRRCLHAVEGDRRPRAACAFRLLAAARGFPRRDPAPRRPRPAFRPIASCSFPPGTDDATNQARYRPGRPRARPDAVRQRQRDDRAAVDGRAGRHAGGKRHGERTGYSILSNLGVTATVAQTGREYVDLAVRLATDEAFMREVRDAIDAKLAGLVLADADAHVRNLEAAYVVALAKSAPDALCVGGHPRAGACMTDPRLAAAERALDAGDAPAAAAKAGRVVGDERARPPGCAAAAFRVRAEARALLGD